MTLVVTLPDDGDIVMMGDSGSGDVRETYLSPIPKVFHSGAYLIGFSGSWRLGQVVRALAFPDPPLGDPPTGDLLAHMTGPFLDVLAASLDENQDRLGKGSTSTPGAEDYKMGGQLVVAAGGRIFIIQPDLTVLESDPGGCAIGGAYKFAYGALFAGARLGLKGEPLARLALDAAARYSGIREPFVTLRLSR